MKLFINQVFALGVFLTFSFAAFAQGPPILSDKPIMLGSKTTVIKADLEIMKSQEGNYIKAPLMYHYIIGPNFLVAAHIPYVQQKLNDGTRSSGLGDVQALFKYQFYQNDGMAKTWRAVVKSLQTLPTGERYMDEDVSSGRYKALLGLVLGYESIKYGFSLESSYEHVPGTNHDALLSGIGFGLPLLKPTYPVEQINLYFEYQSKWEFETNKYKLMASQGIQYAHNQWTYEVAIQSPLYDNYKEGEKPLRNLIIGSRYTF